MRRIYTGTKIDMPIDVKTSAAESLVSASLTAVAMHGNALDGAAEQLVPPSRGALEAKRAEHVGSVKYLDAKTAELNAAKGRIVETLNTSGLSREEKIDVLAGMKAEISAMEGEQAALRDELDLLTEGMADPKAFQQVCMEAQSSRTTLFSEARECLLEWGGLAVRQFAAGGGREGFDAITRHLAAKSRFAGVARGARPEALEDHSMEVQAAKTLVAGLEWATTGFPMVLPTHKLAASLMATRMPVDFVPDLPMPWPSFAIVVPTGLVEYTTIRTTECDTGRARAVRMVGVLQANANGRPSTDGALKVWLAVDGHALLAVWDVANVAQLAELPRHPNDSDENHRARVLLGKLVLGVLAELTDKPHREAIAQGVTSKATGKKRESKTPTAWAFELRRDVKVDLRDWVGEYQRGGGKSPSVQVLVRGHWRNQVCGVGRRARKYIHIEPFWRGPEDAPIVTHGRVLDR